MDIKDNNINNSTDNSDNSGDNRGKFNDRLKQIRKEKMLARKGISLDNNESALKTSARNILKIFLAIPSVVYTSIKSNKEKNKDVSSVSLDEQGDEVLFHYDTELGRRKIKVNKIREINVASLKEKKKLYLKKKRRAVTSEILTLNKNKEESQYLYQKQDKSLPLNENELRVQVLQKEIISLIKKRLVKSLNELEVLQSELYVLSELTGERIHLAECEADIKEIKKLLSRINSLKEKYNYLKENIDFEYMLSYGEDFLVDKILELKELCSLDDVRYVVDNYKILDEYKYLYLGIDKISDDIIRLSEHKNKEIEGLKERDIDFEKFKSEIYNVDRENLNYMSFVEEQERILREIEENVSRINSYEDVTYHIKGFNKLLSNSFKYLGLLLVNPLKGLVPGIATQTLVTKNVVKNLFKSLEWEEKKKIVYEAIDYSDSISRAINDLDYTSLLISSTLEDIIALKEKYKKQFSRYGGEISQYKDAIKKLNKIENAVLGNKLKIDLVKERMKEKEKENDNKLRMVRKLNDSQDK